MVKKNKYSIFIGLLDIVGFYGSLNRGLNEIGHESHILHLGEEQSGYIDNEKIPYKFKFFIYCFKELKKCYKKKSNKLKTFFFFYLYFFSLFILISWILVKIDIILLKSGESFFPTSLIDLKLFKFFKKRIVFIFHGSDIRAPYFNPGESKRNWKHRFDGKYISKQTIKLKKHIDKISNYADLILDHPLYSHLHCKPVLIYQIIGNPIDEKKFQKIEKNLSIKKNNYINILHAPSCMNLKGTKQIRKVIRELKKDGLKIKYKELTNVPNYKVIDLLSCCDILIDEIYSEIYGGMLSTEAGFLGKPSIVCGYGFDELDKFVPKEFRIPTNRSHPKSLKTLLLKLIINKKFRIESGKKMEYFVNKKLSLKNSASNFIKAINGEFDKLTFNPSELNYFSGCGAEEEIIKKRLRAVYFSKGSKGFCLDDKPKVLNNLINFINN